MASTLFASSDLGLGPLAWNHGTGIFHRNALANTALHANEALGEALNPNSEYDVVDSVLEVSDALLSLRRDMSKEEFESIRVQILEVGCSNEFLEALSQRTSYLVNGLNYSRVFEKQYMKQTASEDILSIAGFLVLMVREGRLDDPRVCYSCKEILNTLNYLHFVKGSGTIPNNINMAKVIVLELAMDADLNEAELAIIFNRFIRSSIIDNIFLDRIEDYIIKGELFGSYIDVEISDLEKLKRSKALISALMNSTNLCNEPFHGHTAAYIDVVIVPLMREFVKNKVFQDLCFQFIGCEDESGRIAKELSVLIEKAKKDYPEKK